MPNDVGRPLNLRASATVVVMGLLVALFIIATFSAMAWQRQRDLLHDRQSSNERLADTLAEHVDGIFGQSALVLSMMGERLEREHSASPHPAHDGTFRTFLAAVLKQAPMVAAARVITPDGAYLHSHPELPPQGVGVGDRDYVQAHLRGEVGLFVGKPIVSRVNGRLVLPVSLAQRNSQGRLDAILAVMIQLDDINALFESIRQKPNGTIALFGAEGTLLARGPMDNDLIGKDFSQGPLFREHIPKAATGSYTNVVATDGKLRQASYRRLGDYPAVVSISTLHDDTMAQWRSYVATLALIALPLLLATTAITWALHRQLVERERFERLLARRTSDLELANEELRHMAEISAHHLQEPLRTILSYAQLLVRKAGTGETAGLEEYLGFIRSGTDRMKAQLDALQRYLGVGQCRPLQPVPLQRLLDETIDLLAPRLEAAGTTITSGSLPEIMGDRQHLAGLFHHMISAILERRRPEQSQTIGVSAARDGDMWHLIVSSDNTAADFGDGETSFPLLGAGSSGDKGRGPTLSLALCRKIAQLHGGRLWAETTGDGESRLHVMLPAE